MTINAPASFLRLGLDRIGGGFGYEAVDGSLWEGTITGVRYGKTKIGRVDFEWSPLSVVTGTVTAKIKARGGDGEGNGIVGYGIFSKQVTVTDASVVFDLNSIKRYTLYGLPYQGEVSSKIRRLRLTQEECLEADLDLWTDAMTASAVKLSSQPLDLAGKAQCKEKGLQVLLDGESASGRIAIDAVINADFSYTMAASVVPERTDLQQALTLLGFQREGSSYVYDTIGRLKGVGS